MNKLKKRIISASVAIAVLISSTLSLNVNAYLVNQTGASTINPTKAMFTSAKSPMYTTKTQSISGTINNSYTMNIYHYECQESGLYQFYTTGTTDTIIAVYEEQGLFSYDYEMRGKNDQGYYDSHDNASLVLSLDKYEDYYVCVRAFSGKTGSYTLHIEPNQDKQEYKDYGVWTRQTKVPDLKDGITKKQYYSKGQTELTIVTLLLDGVDSSRVVYHTPNGQAYTSEDLKRAYKKDGWTGVRSLLQVIAEAAITVKYPQLSIPMLVVDCLMALLGGSKSEKQILKQKLESLCNVKYHVYSSGVKISASNGYVKIEKDKYSGGYPLHTKVTYFEASSSSVLIGEKWAYGTWKY